LRDAERQRGGWIDREIELQIGKRFDNDDDDDTMMNHRINAIDW